ncbi:hypothetical protein [Corynebacterium glaucum]|uniref:hypothetical protein n=1 Tax=Corynebacterium glaucum TaxID=187491 RepID=UPI000BAC22D3|nr:hypothetical protein [Corynebacterium glaucum]
MSDFVVSVAGDLATRTNATIVALLALVGITGLAGGFEAAEPEGFVTVSAPLGENPLEPPVELEVEPFEITIRRAYEKDGARVVEMQVTNTASRPLSPTDFMLGFALKNSGLPEDQQPDFDEAFHRLKEIGEVPEDMFGDQFSLNPAVPMDLAMIFSDPYDGTANGQALEADILYIRSREYRTSILDGTKRWLDGETTAEVKLK